MYSSFLCLVLSSCFIINLHCLMFFVTLAVAVFLFFQLQISFVFVFYSLVVLILTYFNLFMFLLILVDKKYMLFSNIPTFYLKCKIHNFKFLFYPGALTYSELGTLIPKTGGDYAYLHQVFGSFPAFIFVWTDMIALRPASNVVRVMTFAEYLLDAVGDQCGPPEYTLKALAAAALRMFSYKKIYSNC